jgi:tetratricopeptide (TPR) repeat protein
MCVRLFSSLLIFCALATGPAHGALESLNQPVPLAASPRAFSAGDTSSALRAARTALEMGLPAAAVPIYQELLARPGTDLRTVTLALAEALIADNRASEARTLLKNFKDTRGATDPGATWHLWAGLAAMQLKDFGGARGELPAVREREAELLPEERSWWYFLQGLLAEQSDDRAAGIQRAKVFYQQAIAAATSEVARTRFQLANQRAQLRISAVPAGDLETWRRKMETDQGRSTGYDAAKTYAVGLNALGRPKDAVAIIQQQLLTLPPQESRRKDDFRLYLGLIAGAGEGVGRAALLELLTNGRDAGLQRLALYLLAENSAREPARSQLRLELSRLIDAPVPHLILDDLLLARANFSLVEKNFSAAEEDARTLLEKFPGSGLKPLALEVLTRSAWEQLRYRTVVDSAARAAEALSADAASGRDARAQLKVLVAEAWFRARDFRNAADAYAVVLRDPPAGANVGELMFQRIQSEIQVPAPDTALTVLDDLARNPAFDQESRWQAEWNVAQALLGGSLAQLTAGYTRVNQLLAGPAPGLKPELRARMKWLQAKLAIETGDERRALEAIAVELPPLLMGLEPELRVEIASKAALLKASAHFARNEEAEALATLKKIRTDFPKTSAVASSVMAEANHYAEQEKTVEAQQLFTKFADDFPQDVLAPYALYRAALQAARRGNLEEANQRIEDLFARYQHNDLEFEARLKQGDLLRLMNQSPQAQQAYELLINSFGSRPDVVLAQLALAQCHSGQSFGDPAHTERALVLFQSVRDRVNAPWDLRVEAGYNYGRLLVQRDELEKAAAAWWTDVVQAFLVEPGASAKLQSKGRYWMARTLLELGSLLEQQKKHEQAKEAWLKILEAKLGQGYETEARMRLSAYGVAEPKP